MPKKPSAGGANRGAKKAAGRHRILAWVAACAMAAVVALVIVALVIMLRSTEAPPSAVPSGVLPPSSTTKHPHKPRPAAQDASCPDVLLLSIPGTWESSATDDPVNPVANPRALLLNVTGPLTGQFPGSRAAIYTVPYTAQFSNPLARDSQMSYNDSRAEGTRTAVKVLADMSARCPLTSYVIIGFSQGAVIAGDIVSDIGNGRGPVDDDLVIGTTLIADGRREQGVGIAIPPNPPGEGAEITLHEVPILANLGLTMTGPRPGGFGVLNDSTNEICAPGDLICAAPQEAFSPTSLPATLNTLAAGGGAPVHALYATPDFWNSNGEPATAWTLDWVRDQIQKAPHPAHR